MTDESSGGYYLTILNAIPSMVFVVDEDVRIHDLNQAAKNTFDFDKSAVLGKRGGEALQCIHHFESQEGCGTADYCKNCIIRNSVNKAANGEAITRNRMRAELRTKNGLLKLDLLVTTSKFDVNNEKRILLMLEDISEITKLREILPICASCKKIRNDKNYWSTVEKYFAENSNIDFSHGICPDCLKKEYPDVYDDLKKDGKIS